MVRCRSGICERNARLIFIEVRVRSLGSQVLQTGLKSPNLRAMFVVAYLANFSTDQHDFLLHDRSHSALQQSRKKSQFPLPVLAQCQMTTIYPLKFSQPTECR